MKIETLIWLGVIWPVTLLLGLIAIEYYDYCRTRARSCKRALKKTLWRLKKERKRKRGKTNQLTSKLASLRERMSREIVRHTLEEIPVSEVTNAQGIGEKGARLLALGGFRTAKDLDRISLSRIKEIEGFGDYRAHCVKDWLNQTKQEISRRAKHDPHFKEEIRRIYAERARPLRCKKVGLERKETAFQGGIETIHKELERYKSVRFVNYLRRRISVKPQGLRLSLKRPRKLEEIETTGYIEQRELPGTLFERIERQNAIRRHLQHNFQDMEPREFEKFVADLLKRLGHSNIKITSPGYDMGADVTSTDEKGRSTVVEVKRYKAGNRVGNRKVRGLIGAMDYYHAERAIFVTTSDYTFAAKKQVSDIDSIELWSGPDVKRKTREAFPDEKMYTEMVDALESSATSKVLFRLEEVSTGNPVLVCDKGLLLVRGRAVVKYKWTSEISIVRRNRLVELKGPDLDTVIAGSRVNQAADIIEKRILAREENLKEQFREQGRRIDEEYGDEYLWSSYGIVRQNVSCIRLYSDKIAWAMEEGVHKFDLRDITSAVTVGDDAVAISSSKETVELGVVEPEITAEWLNNMAESIRIESVSKEEKVRTGTWKRVLVLGGTSLLVFLCAISSTYRPSSPTIPTTPTSPTTPTNAASMGVVDTRSIPITPTMTVTPVSPTSTSVPISTPRPTVTSTTTPTPTSQPNTPAPLPLPSCPNTDARITYPTVNAKLEGIVEVKGSANIDNLWYYKFEFKYEGAEVWCFLQRFDEPVEVGVLGTWDVSELPTGVYRFRLVVVDDTGNYPEPCEVRVLIEN